MNSEILQKNFLHLKSLHPNAYEAVKEPINILEYEISLANSGLPTLSYISPNKNNIFLLSKYDPLNEAKKIIEALNVREYTNFIVLGMGLGYQTIELINSIPEHSKIILIENDRNLARLAFETTDLSQILIYPGLTLLILNEIKNIPTLLDHEKMNFCLNGYKIIQQNSLSEVNPHVANKTRKTIIEYFEASKIELKTQSVKSKTYYKNIFQNYHNILNTPGVSVLKDSMRDIPAIICSAGPSLDKNINLLKGKRDNFLLISVATALESLLKNHISPDFVVAIDPNEVMSQFFNLEKDLINTWLVYDPVIPSVIPNFFKEKRFIYDSPIILAQWFKKYLGEKGSLGKVFSVAHASYKIAELLGCSPIILIGQDLSFSRKRLHSRNSYYYQDKEDQINRIETMETLDGVKFHKYSKNILQRKDIFNNNLTTTISMETYAQMFSAAIGNSQNTYNATEGGIRIKESKQILLREAINNYCKFEVNLQKVNILNSNSMDPIQNSQIIKPAKSQLIIFKELFRNLNELGKVYLNTPPLTDKEKRGFVLEMKIIIEKLLKNEDTALLLQGYDFKGFSLWNQKSTETLRKRSLQKNNDLLEEEFRRDKDFFAVLTNSLKFNINIFESLADPKKSI